MGQRLFLTMFVALFSSLFSFGKMKIAVFDPESVGVMIDNGTKVAVRELISNTIVNDGNYEIVERSLLEKVMQEQQFSNSGIVDEKDATQIGRLAGANKVVLAVITQTGNQNMLSIKLLDVTTAGVERQQVRIVNGNELLASVEPMTKGIVGDTAISDSNRVPLAAPSSNIRSVPTRQIINNVDDDEIIIQLFPYEGETEDRELGTKIQIKIDGEKFGELNVGDGGVVRVKKRRMKTKKDGMHKLQVGDFNMKFHEEDYNYFELASDSYYAGKINKKGMFFPGAAVDKENGERPTYGFHISLKDNRMIK